MSENIKYGAYVINLDDYADVGTHWIALYALNNYVIYFDSFGVEHIPKKIKKFIGNKNIKTNIFRIQAKNLIMYGYFCIGFINFMLAGKTLIDYICFIITVFTCEATNAHFNNETLFRLNRINKIEDYFTTEIKEREAMSKKPNKYIADFDYFDKTLFYLQQVEKYLLFLLQVSLELL